MRAACIPYIYAHPFSHICTHRHCVRIKNGWAALRDPPMLPKGKRVRKGRGLQGPGKTETQVVEAITGCTVAAIRHTAAPRVGDPRPAATNTVGA